MNVGKKIVIVVAVILFAGIIFSLLLYFLYSNLTTVSVSFLPVSGAFSTCPRL